MNKTKFNLGLLRLVKFIYWLSGVSLSYVVILSIYSILFLGVNPIGLQEGYQIVITSINLYLFNNYIKLLKGVLDEQRTDNPTPGKTNK